MKNLSLTQQQLLALVRLGIGSDAQADECLRQDIGWKAIVSLAEEQTVVGVVADGVQRLPEELWPERRMRLQWFGLAAMQTEQNAVVNAAMADLVKVLEQEQISYCIVKGQTLGALYPNPDARQAGDVDFYVPAGDFQHAKTLIEQRLSVKVEGEERADKHDSFVYRDVRFEMHYRLETFGISRHQRHFDRMIDQALEVEPVTRHITDMMVRVLPPEGELVMTFKHLFNHLLMEGVGLRQLCDLLILLLHYPPAGRQRLESLLHQIGYYEAFMAMGATLVSYLGLSPERFPFTLRQKDYRWADRLIEVPLDRGNFGKYNRKTFINQLGHKLDTAAIAFGHCLRFLPLAPSDIAGLIPTRIGIAMKMRCSVNEPTE